MSISRSLQSGVSIVEVILGVAIITGMVGAIGLTVNTYVDTREDLLLDTKALYLTEDGLELMRAARDTDWNTIDALPLDTPLAFDLSGGTIAITTTPEVIDSTFTRTFEVHALYRNASDDVVDSSASGATVDDEGRAIEMNVVGTNGTTTLETIITNLYAAS